jgi:glucosamine-6-phosphate deaminase
MGMGESAPNHAITMGIDTIMKAKRIFIVAFSEDIANMVAATIEGPETEKNPASSLQSHPNC